MTGFSEVSIVTNDFDDLRVEVGNTDCLRKKPEWDVERIGIRERLGKKADGRTAERVIWKDWDCERSGDREQKVEGNRYCW